MLFINECVLRNELIWQKEVSICKEFGESARLNFVLYFPGPLLVIFWKPKNMNAIHPIISDKYQTMDHSLYNQFWNTPQQWPLIIFGAIWHDGGIEIE